MLGWAAAAALVAVLPLSAFFALDAFTYLVSALLVSRIGPSEAVVASEQVDVSAGLRVVRSHREIAIAVLALGAAVTISSGTWIVGVPELVRSTLGAGAGSFSLVAASYAAGSIVAALVLARWPIRRKAREHARLDHLPGRLQPLRNLGHARIGARRRRTSGAPQVTAIILLTAAAQEEVSDRFLGRAMGVIALTHRGAHATGLLLVGPLFAVLAPPAVFAGAAVGLAAIGLVGTVVAGRARHR